MAPQLWPVGRALFPTRPPGLCPLHQGPVSLSQPCTPVPPQGVGSGGHQLAERYGAESLVATRGCGPCQVTGRPSGASSCSWRQNNARRAARAPRAAPLNPAWSHLRCLSRASPTLGSPSPLLTPGLYLSPTAGSCTGCSWLVAQHGTECHSVAQLFWGCMKPSAKQHHLHVFLPACPVAAAHAREGVGGFTLGRSVLGIGAQRGSVGPASSPGRI